MTFTTLRADLARDLDATGYTVYDHVPDQVDAFGPVLLIEPADDYLTYSDTFALNEYTASLDVWLLVPRGDSAANPADLDAALAELLPAIPSRFLLTATSKPMTAEAGEQTLYGIRLTLTTTTHL